MITPVGVTEGIAAEATEGIAAEVMDTQVADMEVTAVTPAEVSEDILAREDTQVEDTVIRVESEGTLVEATAVEVTADIQEAKVVMATLD